MNPEQHSAGLPAPDPVALAHSEQLLERILAAIDAAGGSIAFSRFMEMALYEPGLGYYSSGATKFGAAGDFVTAVSHGDFLARAIVATLAPRLAALAEPVIVELGAGTGQLAFDLLRLLDASGFADVGYRILEPSPDLRERQRDQLAHYAERVQWIDRLDPSSVCGCIVANEVADALPVDRVVLTQNGWQQVAVGRDGTALRWLIEPLSESGQREIDAIAAQLPEPLPVGYTTEIRPLLVPWVRALAEALENGDVLIVDYGLSRREYFHPQRGGGTLICHYRHRAHTDPFFGPGIQDITAWVDFSRCADAAGAAGLEVVGYTTQGSWIAAALAADPALMSGLDIHQASQLRTLLLPGEMGEKFKALLLSRGEISGRGAALPGRDLRSRL